MKLKTYIRHPARVLFSIGMHGYFRYLNDEQFVKLMYRCKFGRKLNLESPQTFNEKIQWLKLNERNPLCSTLVDKYEVKKYIAEKIGEQYIIPTIGVWDQFDGINFDKLPEQFVLKCTHDSGGIVICHDKAQLDIAKTRKVIEESMKRNYYWIGREWPYKNVKSRIIAEPLMKDESGKELKDYKIFNFNGVPKAVQVDYDRFSNHRRNIYDVEWNYIPVEILYPTDPKVQIPKPQCLSEMLKLAEILSAPFIHVRTDFYIIKDQIYFGEMTFLHGAGFEEFRPASFGVQMGEWMELPSSSDEKSDSELLKGKNKWIKQ